MEGGAKRDRITVSDIIFQLAKFKPDAEVSFRFQNNGMTVSFDEFNSLEVEENGSCALITIKGGE